MPGGRGKLWQVFPVRVAVASALAALLAACSAITSFSGLEAPGGSDSGEGREAALPGTDDSGDDSFASDSSPEDALNDSSAYADVAPIGDGNGTQLDVTGDATQEAGADGMMPQGDASPGDVSPVGDARQDAGADGMKPVGDAAPVGDATSVGDVSSGEEASTEDASLGDATSDGTLIGDASPGDATVDAIVPEEAAPPSDSASPPTDSSDACTPDASSDPNNCGACGHSCQGGACTAGVCGPVTLAVTHGSLGIALDSVYVYWADSTAGAINKVGKALTHSGTPSAVVSGTAAQGVQGIATDTTYIYWTNKAAGQVHRALPTGAALTTLATGQQNPDWIASNGSIVAWTNQTGNQVMALAFNSDGGVAPTQLNLVNENGTTPAGIAIDSVAVYYATKNVGGGLAEFVPLDGGAVAELGTGTYIGIAQDTNNVYWTGGAGNPIVYQISKSGALGSEISIASGSLICPLAIASDGTNVYFLDQGTSGCAGSGSATGALYRVPVGNGGTLPAPLVSGLNDPQGLALDGATVYWVTGGTPGAVMKLAK
jgi:hypothetical protein